MKISIDGIYDSRTIINLKSLGINTFNFDFNPRSFNFIQEHVFLDLYKKNISENDFVFLSFTNNEDYFLSKLINDLKDLNPTLKNIFFIFNELTDNISNFKFNFFVRYNLNLSKKINENAYLKGIILDFTLFQETFNNGTMLNFCNNLNFQFPKLITGELNFILNLDWQDNLISSLLDFFEINFINLKITKDVEVCYRNVDVNLLKKEVLIKQKNLNR